MEHQWSVRFIIKNFTKFLSAQPNLLCIQLLPSYSFLLPFSLFVFIKPSFYEHGIIITNVQNKELWGSKKKENQKISIKATSNMENSKRLLIISKVDPSWNVFCASLFIHLSPQKNLQQENHSNFYWIADADDRLNFYLDFFSAVNLHLTSCGDVFANLNRRDVSWNVQGQKSQRLQTVWRSDASNWNGCWSCRGRSKLFFPIPNVFEKSRVGTRQNKCFA